MRSIAILLLIAFSVFPADAALPRVGDLAPPIEIEHFFQNPEGYQSWEDLRGKVVILEFWATWCGPCVASMPHLNEIAEAYKDDNVVVITITDEEPELIERWQANMRERRPDARIAIEGIVGMDTNNSMSEAYDVRFIPHTVVVDGYGRIASITDPRELTHERMEAFLTGHRDTPRPQGVEPPPEDQAAPVPPVGVEDIDVGTETPGVDAYRAVRRAPLQGVMFGASAGEVSVAAVGRHVISAYSTPYQYILGYLWDAEPHQLDTSSLTTLEQGWFTFDLVVNFPEDRWQEGRHLARETVMTTLGISVRTERRVEPGYALRQAADGHHMRDGVGVDLGSMLRGDSVVSESAPLDIVTSFLSGALDVPVVDETGLDGFYDIRIEFAGAAPKDYAAILEDQLGLTIVPSDVTLEVHVFEPLDAD